MTDPNASWVRDKPRPPEFGQPNKKRRDAWHGPVVRTIYAFIERQQREGFRHSWTADTAPSQTRSLGVIHPSGLGHCLRQVYYTRIGEVPIVRTRPASVVLMDTGTGIHAQLQSYLKAELGDAFIPEVPIRMTHPAPTEGHTDGIYFHTPETEERFGCLYTFLLEIKSINQGGFNKSPVLGPNGSRAPKIDHRWQTLEYMLARGIWVTHVLYYNKNTSEMAEIPYHWDEAEWKFLSEQRIAIVESHVRRGVPAPPSLDALRCPECPYLHLCPDGEAFITGGGHGRP